MPNNHFQFKQFTVWHDKCAMKVGTDGVLLGAWATIRSEAAAPSSILDIGTGTGLIALMIAQRNKYAQIDAIDIDINACKQATDNIEQSPFKSRIKVINQSFTDYSTDKKYDLIVSNPPYFTNSLKCPDVKRSMARHNDSLPLKLLIKHAISMLSETGCISLILPISLSEDFELLIATHKLYVVRRTDIVPVEGAQPKRFLIEISVKNRNTTEYNTLTLEYQGRKRTEQYQKFTNDFYLY